MKSGLLISRGGGKQVKQERVRIVERIQVQAMLNRFFLKLNVYLVKLPVFKCVLLIW